tara:strand:- start:477 stop:1406 length:930 start_codon:yes stop_codon:yes gene_type:complete
MHISLDAALQRQPLLSTVGDKLLPTFPGAAAAYSLRALNGDANNVVRVRRSSDDAERDFTAEGVSFELEDWVGAGNDGFVETWYDQSGNNNHAVQLNTELQPQIVSAGSYLEKLDFDGVNDFLEVDNSTATFKFLHDETTSSIFAVTTYGESSNPENDFALLSTFNGSSSETGILLGYDDRSSLSRNNAYRHIVSNGSGGGNYSVDNLSNDKITPNQKILLSTLTNPDSGTAADRDIARVNGGSFIQDNSKTTAPSASNSDNNLTIGALTSAAYLLGSIEEIIIYDSDQSANRPAIESNIADEYGITLS